MLPLPPSAAVSVSVSALAGRLLAVPVPDADADAWHPLCVSAVSKFCGVARPPLSLRDYVARFADCAANDEDEGVALVTALVLYERAARRAGGAVPEAAHHRLFAVAYTVASKLTADTDIDVGIGYLARVAGVCAAELRCLERVFLADILAFDVAVSPADFALAAAAVDVDVDKRKEEGPLHGQLHAAARAEGGDAVGLVGAEDHAEGRGDPACLDDPAVGADAERGGAAVEGAPRGVLQHALGDGRDTDDEAAHAVDGALAATDGRGAVAGRGEGAAGGAVEEALALLVPALFVPDGSLHHSLFGGGGVGRG